MKVAVLGVWHLGSVTAACTAAAGITTVGIDDEAPLYEPGLTELLRSGLDTGKLRFTTDTASVVEADVVWVCFDTPVDDEDRADVAYVTRRIEAIFPHLKNGAVVLISAQVPVGSIAALEKAFAKHRNGRDVAFACSPENLRLGRAIQIFQNPGRIIVGVRDGRSCGVLEPLLRNFCDNLIWMTVESAEMVKHALNAFLAVSITFTNEIATICESVGADAAEVEAGLRSDPRIGMSAYVKAGPAFAGGTLARDVNFLGGLAREHGLVVPVVDGVLASNRAHSLWLLAQLRRALRPLSGHTVAVLGLAYKPGTNTLRRSTSIELIRALVKEGAQVRAFDPKVSALPDDLSGRVTLAENAMTAARGAHALVVATEWPDFRNLSAKELAQDMAGNIILDASRFLGETFTANSRLSLISVGRMS
jgi:UDPglucose 6-dehydrogenase